MEIERSVAPVKQITLKVSRTEAYELMDYITEYHKRYPYLGAGNQTSLHKALMAGVNGKTSVDVKKDDAFAKIFGPGINAQVRI